MKKPSKHVFDESLNRAVDECVEHKNMVHSGWRDSTLAPEGPPSKITNTLTKEMTGTALGGEKTYLKIGQRTKKRAWAEGDIAYIPLSREQVAIIDKEDFEKIADFSWSAVPIGITYKKNYYAQRMGRENGKYKRYVIHRIVMNAKDGETVDHINGDGLDNRKSNLRICTQAENMRNSNMGKGRKDQTSQYKGVCWNKREKKWRACIKVMGKRTELGRFQNERDAAIAYNAAATLLHGEFANLNTL